jgi:hypothetical protein
MTPDNIEKPNVRETEGNTKGEYTPDFLDNDDANALADALAFETAVKLGFSEGILRSISTFTPTE